MSEISDIVPDQPDNSAYAALVALKPENLALGAWATKAGLARNYFTNLREHGRPGDSSVDKLLGAAGRSRSDYARLREIFERGDVAPANIADVTRAFGSFPPAKPLEVLGTAIGGEFDDLDEQIELTELHLHEVIDRVERPAGLMNDDHAYALMIVGESMVPRFKPRERVTVGPKSGVAIGDDVIVQLRGLDGEDERIKIVLIKELVKRTASYVELRQYNPDITFRVPIERVARIHRVWSVYI